MHTPKTCFYLPSGLHNFSEWYFFFLLQNRLFSKEFSVSLFWFKMDWKTRWNKRALFLVFMLETKKEEKMTQKSLLRTFLISIQTKKKKTTSIPVISLTFPWSILLTYLCLYPFNWTVICSKCSKFSKTTPPALMHTSYSIILKAQQINKLSRIHLKISFLKFQ